MPPKPSKRPAPAGKPTKRPRADVHPLQERLAKRAAEDPDCANMELGKCVSGWAWIREGAGFRCAGRG